MKMLKPNRYRLHVTKHLHEKSVLCDLNRLNLELVHLLVVGHVSVKNVFCNLWLLRLHRSVEKKEKPQLPKRSVENKLQYEGRVPSPVLDTQARHMAAIL